MDEENKTDVNNGEGQTPDASSSVEQPLSDAAVTTEATEESKTVPYERFAEVNESARATKAEIAELRQQIAKMENNTVKENLPQEDPSIAAAKEQLKGLIKEIAPELGYVSKDELRQQEQDKTLQTTLSNLETKYNGSDGRPKFDRKEVVKFAIDNGVSDAEAAYKLKHEAELDNWKIEQALTKSRGVATEGSNGSGSSESGTSNDDLKAAAMKGDKKAHLTYLQRIIPKG